MGKVNEKKLFDRLKEIEIAKTFDSGEGNGNYRKEFEYKYGKDWQNMTLFDLCIKGDNYER